MIQNDIRNRLIDGTICVIAREGFDKATTKQIRTVTSVNEAYIYRCFKGKEDMFAKTFDSLDNELATKLTQHIPVMYMSEMEFELRCRCFFFAIWEFLMANREKCLAFIRYYYSPYFKKYSANVHKQRYQPLIEKFSEFFIDEADVWMILNHILNVMMGFAIKVHNDQMPKDDNYTEHVFRVIYRSVEQYFKEEEVKAHE